MDKIILFCEFIPPSLTIKIDLKKYQLGQVPTVKQKEADL